MVQMNLVAITGILNLEYISNICHKTDYGNTVHIEKKMADTSCLSNFVRETLPLYCAYCQVKYRMASMNPLKPYKEHERRNKQSVPESYICDLNGITQEPMGNATLSIFQHSALKQKKNIFF